MTQKININMSKDYINFENTKFLISSHIYSYESAEKILRSSLIKNNIPNENIITVIAQSDTNLIEGNKIYTNHNSYDHTAIIEVIKNNLFSPYWFIMHDTCECGDQFYNLLTQKIITKDYVAMSEMAWLNMGLFSNNFIFSNQNYILSLENCSKKRAILSERVFSKLGDFDYFGMQKDVQTIRNCRIYNDNKKRIALYFPYLDFYKYQSYEAQKVMEFKG